MVQNLPKQQPNAHYYFRDKQKIQPISPFYGQEMRRHANILGGE